MLELPVHRTGSQRGKKEVKQGQRRQAGDHTHTLGPMKTSWINPHQFHSLPWWCNCPAGHAGSIITEMSTHWPRSQGKVGQLQAWPLAPQQGEPANVWAAKCLPLHFCSAFSASSVSCGPPSLEALGKGDLGNVVQSSQADTFQSSPGSLAVQCGEVVPKAFHIPHPRQLPPRSAGSSMYLQGKSPLHSAIPVALRKFGIPRWAANGPRLGSRR